MSHPRLRKPRPLVSMRPITKNNTTEKLAHVSAPPDINSNSEMLKEGIHGNAMAVPPPHETSSGPSTDERPKSDRKPPRSSGSTGSVLSHEHCEKEIKEVLSREKLLKDQVSSLQRQISELKIALKGKEEEIKDLQEQLEVQGKELREQLSAEQSNHETTKLSLDIALGQVIETQAKIDTLEGKHREELNASRLQLEQQMKESLAAKNAEIADRDRILSRLKSQMADALKGNSWERQQQLEELTKELSRIQEESDMLRLKIKVMSKSKQGQCVNCDENSGKVKQVQS